MKLFLSVLAVGGASISNAAALKIKQIPGFNGKYVAESTPDSEAMEAIGSYRKVADKLSSSWEQGRETLKSSPQSMHVVLKGLAAQQEKVLKAAEEAEVS